MHTHPLRFFVKSAFAASLVTAFAACGGGGGGGDDDDSGAQALRFSAAPTLAAAPSPLPKSSATQRNVCNNYRFGDRDIENLDVPDGARCVLEPGVSVDGNVELGTGSSFYARDVSIGGNLQGQRASVVLLEASTVGGSVQLDLGKEVTLGSNRIEGSVQLNDNDDALFVLGNTVGSDIQVFQNTGGASISDNRVDGNLQCKENGPAPTGGGNQAASKEDQCAGL